MEKDCAMVCIHLFNKLPQTIKRESDLIKYKSNVRVFLPKEVLFIIQIKLCDSKLSVVIVLSIFTYNRCSNKSRVLNYHKLYYHNSYITWFNIYRLCIYITFILLQEITNKLIILGKLQVLFKIEQVVGRHNGNYPVIIM